MNGSPCGDIVGVELSVISELLSTVNEPNLVDLDTLLLLQTLLNLEDRVVRLEVVCLLSVV